MTIHGDDHYMRRAIEVARGAKLSAGDGPFGCVIVLNGAIIGEGRNEVFAQNDATAHAEVVAMRRAGAWLRAPILRGATLYSTLQPCGMCTMASIWSNITRIVYGAQRNQVHQMYFEDRHLDTMDFICDAFRRDIEISGGLLSRECAELYYGPDDHPPRDEQTNI